MTVSAEDRDERKRQTVRFYDVESLDYDASRYETPGGRRVDTFHKRVLRERLFDSLPVTAAVLELGCGTGRLLSHFRASHPDIVGVDASFGMLAVGRNRAVTAVTQGDAYRLPFRDDTFDAVYAILVVNLLDVSRAFAEVARVLKPGGRFLFNVPNLASIYALGGLYVNLRKKTIGRNRAGHRPSHWFRFHEVAGRLATAGLTIIDVVGQPPLVSQRANASSIGGHPPASFFCKSRYFVATKASNPQHA